MLIAFNLCPFVINDEKIMMTAFIFGFFFAMGADRMIIQECKKIIKNRLPIVLDENDSQKYIFKILSKVWLFFICCIVLDMACIPQMGQSYYSSTWWYGHQNFVRKYTNANNFGNINGCSTSLFYELIGSVLLFHAIDISPFLQMIFDLPPMIYIGKISFSLYLVHLPLIYTVSTQLFLTFYENYKITYDYSVASTFVIMVPIWLLVAHVFWYLIDSHAIIWSNKVVEYIFPAIVQKKMNTDNQTKELTDLDYNNSSITHTIICE